MLLLAAMVAAIVIGAIVFFRSTEPLDSPDAAASALRGIGFFCHPIPQASLGEDTPFIDAITCTKGDAHVSVLFVAEDADEDVLRGRVARNEDACSDVDQDGAVFFGMAKPVWIEVNATTSTAEDIHPASVAAVGAVASTLGVPLRNC